MVDVNIKGIVIVKAQHGLVMQSYDSTPAFLPQWVTPEDLVSTICTFESKDFYTRFETRELFEIVNDVAARHKYKATWKKLCDNPKKIIVPKK